MRLINLLPIFLLFGLAMATQEIIVAPTLTVSQYSPYAELAYAIGLLLFVVLLFLSLNVFHEKRGTLIKGVHLRTGRC